MFRWFRRRRAAAGVVLLAAAFICTTVGVLPSVGQVGKWMGSVSGERYPCEGGACACSSAKECWTTCRCHSLNERVAWAAREGVAVPDYVDVSAVALAAADGEIVAGCPLCAAKNSSELAEGLLDGEACGAAEGDNDAQTKGLPTLTVLGCKGIEMLMAIGVVLVIPPDPMVGVMGYGEVGAVDPGPGHVLVSRPIDVVTPPPEG